MTLKQHLARIGRSGGLSRSRAKRQAAQRNGQLGGRPRKRVKAQPPALPESKKELRPITPEQRAAMSAALKQFSREQI